MEKLKALHCKCLKMAGRPWPFDYRLEKETLVPQMKAQNMLKKKAIESHNCG